MNTLNFKPFPTVTTDRLVLRQLSEDDARIIFNYQSNKENFEFVDMPVYTRIEEAKKYVAKMNKGVRDNKWIIWAIADPKSNIILGTISIWNISKDQSKAELGYGLFPGNRGKGIMSEAMKCVVAYGLNTMGLKNIEAYTNIENEKSITLLERNHFTKRSLFTETETFSGEPMDMVIYEYKQGDCL